LWLDEHRTETFSNTATGLVPGTRLDEVKVSKVGEQFPGTDWFEQVGIAQ